MLKLPSFSPSFPHSLPHSFNPTFNPTFYLTFYFTPLPVILCFTTRRLSLPHSQSHWQVLTGQTFVHLVSQFSLISRMEGLLEITAVDAADININYLKDKALSLSKAARGAVFCIDKRKDDIYFDADMADGSKKEIRIPLKAPSMVGTSIRGNEIINIPDCYEDERFNPATDLKTGFRTKQLLCVPVTTSKGEVIAAIQIINSADGLPFTEQDIEFLQVEHHL